MNSPQKINDRLTQIELAGKANGYSPTTVRTVDNVIEIRIHHTPQEAEIRFIAIEIGLQALSPQPLGNQCVMHR